MRMYSLGLFSPVLVSCLVTSVLSQTPVPKPQASIPTIEANARAVVVDVVVTKGNDEPVSGLRKEDFKLTEDGSEQSVVFFEEHTKIVVPPAQLAPMPPNVFTNVPDAPPASAVNVVLLDALNTEVPDQSYVREEVIAFLKSLPRGTPLAVFTLVTRLKMVQGFTDDPTALLASLLDKKNGVWPETTAVSRSIADDGADASQLAKMKVMQSSPYAIAARSSSQQAFKAYEAGDRVEMTALALQNLARYIAKIPGRKNLIWFASRFPVGFFPNTNAIGALQVGRQTSGLKQATDVGPQSNALKETADLLTVSRVAIYPVGARGVERITGGDAEYAKGEGPTGEQGDIMSNTFAMNELAADTGGEAIKNTNDLSGALGRAIQNGSHYYTLSYTPTNKTWDGQFRRIAVKLPEGKFTVSYRRGYWAFDSARTHSATPANARSKPNVRIDAPITESPLQPLMQRGVPSSTQILYGLHVVPASGQFGPDAARAGANTKLAGPVTRYSVDFLIRSTDVNLESMPDGTHRGRIQVEMIAYDRDGKALNWVGATMGMNIQPDLYASIQKSGLPAHLEIDVPKGDAFLATGVYDWNTAKVGTLEVPLSAVAVGPKPIQDPITGPK